MESKHFSPTQSFLHLKIVWLVIILLFSIALVISIVIIKNTQIGWDLSANGFNNFISLFRFPLGILTLIIPIVALLAANHRSEQTKEQIRVTGLQNDFANYYKHLEEFIKYVDKQERLKNLAGARYIHKMLYPNAQEGKYGICENLHLTIIKANEIPLQLLRKYPSNFKEKIQDDDLSMYINTIDTLFSFIEESVAVQGRVNVDGVEIDQHSNKDKPHQGTYLSQSIELIDKILFVIKKLDQVCHFSVEHKSIQRKKVFDDFSTYDYRIEPKPEKPMFGKTYGQEQTFEMVNDKFKRFLENFNDFSFI